MPKVKFALTKMRCLEETNEPSASEEPYVLVFASQLKKVAGLVTIPAASTTMYGPWENVDKGELVSTAVNISGPLGKFLNHPSKNFWGLDGKPHDLNSPDEAIFIAALMENDDAQAGGIRAGLHAQLFAAITSYANAGMSRASMVSKLKKDAKDILTGVTVTGIPSSDDLIGVAEIPYSAADLQAVNTKTIVKNIELAGDGGKYRLRFEMSK
ncbi:hypothetical protein [Ferruginibacter sp.]